VLYTYRVEEIVFVGGGRRPTRVLTLRRLDGLNVHRSLLGMQAEHLRDPVVLLDSVEEIVLARVLPAMAEGAPLALGDDEWNASAEGAEVGAATGIAVRDEVALALGSEAGRVREVGRSIRERAAIERSWREQLGSAGGTLVDLDTLYLPAGWSEQLEGHVDRQSLWRAAEIEDSLRKRDAAGVIARLADLMSGAVARQEAQHGRDSLRERPLRQPALLAEWVGPEADAEEHERRGAVSAKAELSAYTAEIASDPLTPRLSLALLCRFIFDRDSRGATESYVAAALVDRLAAQLGLPLDGPPIHDGQIDRHRLATAYLAILAIPEPRLRSAAAAVWASLFGEPLVPLL
jgi:hypothetical protein